MTECLQFFLCFPREDGKAVEVIYIHEAAGAIKMRLSAPLRALITEPHWPSARLERSRCARASASSPAPAAPAAPRSDMVVKALLCNISTTDSSPSGLGPGTDAPGGLSRTGHTVVAVFLGFILVAGVLSNSLVVVVFGKFRCLRTPINLILLNISVSDILVCVSGTPLSLAASVRGSWLLGERGCRWYGFSNSLFGEWHSPAPVCTHG